MGYTTDVVVAAPENGCYVLAADGAGTLQQSHCDRCCYKREKEQQFFQGKFQRELEVVATSVAGGGHQVA